MSDAKRLADHLWRYAKSERVNNPQDYIAYLKTQPRFKGCGLNGLPHYAVILHDARVEEHLVKLGYSGSDCRQIGTGTTDPHLLYLVRGRGGDPDSIINCGLSGAGGVATQAVELSALGVRKMVHVGTCGLARDEMKPGVMLQQLLFGLY
jgi:hypothetical protein